MGPKAGQKFIWILSTSRTVCRPALEGKLFSSSHPGLSPNNTCSNRNQEKQKYIKEKYTPIYQFHISQPCNRYVHTYIKLKITSQIHPLSWRWQRKWKRRHSPNRDHTKDNEGHNNLGMKNRERKEVGKGKLFEIVVDSMWRERIGIRKQRTIVWSKQGRV